MNKITTANRAWIYKPSYKKALDRIEGGQKRDREFLLAILWNNQCNLGKIYGVVEGSNTQNRIHIFCNLWQEILRIVTLTMLCAFLLLFISNVYKFVQSSVILLISFKVIFSFMSRLQRKVILLTSILRIIRS